jgi:hypothetical protein
MKSYFSIVALVAFTAASPVADAQKAAPSSSVVKTTTCGGKTYTYNNFAGYGFVPFSAKDSAGDTLGGIGSSAAIEQRSWKKSGGGKNGSTYTGVLWTCLTAVSMSKAPSTTNRESLNLH